MKSIQEQIESILVEEECVIVDTTNKQIYIYSSITNKVNPDDKNEVISLPWYYTKDGKVIRLTEEKKLELIARIYK